MDFTRLGFALPKNGTPDGEEKKRKGKFRGRLTKLQQVDHTSAVDHNVARLQCMCNAQQTDWRNLMSHLIAISVGHKWLNAS